MTTAALLDVDGTLVDSNYHHALAWYRAFRGHDLTPPVWRIHRHIGMGARELIVALKERGHAVVLASSGHGDDVERYIDLLDARALADFWTTSDDVERTKPAPDLVAVAMRRAETLSAVMVGDSTWDIAAATHAELKTLAVLTGGYSEAELLEAGAVAVFESLVVLCERLDDTPLR